jgi:hypothetical protein
MAAVDDLFKLRINYLLAVHDFAMERSINRDGIAGEWERLFPEGRHTEWAEDAIWHGIELLSQSFSRSVLVEAAREVPCSLTDYHVSQQPIADRFPYASKAETAVYYRIIARCNALVADDLFLRLQPGDALDARLHLAKQLSARALTIEQAYGGEPSPLTSADLLTAESLLQRNAVYGGSLLDRREERILRLARTLLQ